MRKLLLLFCLAWPSWGAWSNGYNFTATFTFGVHPSANLTAFPNLILGTYASLADIAHGGQVTHTVTLNGVTVPADLIITTDSGGTVLTSWDIISWDNTTGAIKLYVKADRLAASDTLLYAWVGNSSVTTYQCTASSTYGDAGLWHVETVTGGANSVLDSTANANNGSPSGSPTNVTGQVGGAGSFNATTKYVDLGTPASLELYSNVMLSAWIKTSTGGPDFVLAKDFSTGARGYCLGLGGGGNIMIEAGGSDYYPGGAVLSDNVWHYIVATLAANGTDWVGYVDGASVGTATGSAITANSAAHWYISGRAYVGYFQGFPGYIDEARIRSGLPTNVAAWIAHEYRQQKQASAWYTVSSWLGTGLNLSGCTSGSMRVASATCTVTLVNDSFDGVKTVTLSDGGNLGTFTSGSSGNPLTVTPSAGTTFTFTYTPYLVGHKIITTTNAYGWTNIAATYTVTSADVSTFTAAANGNWATGGTGTCTTGCSTHNTPDSGDTVTLPTNKHVTIAAGTTAYVGTCPTANTTASVTITSASGTNGELEVAGTATLWLCGNIKLNAPSNSNPTHFAILKIDTGASVVLDNDNHASVALNIFPATTNGWNNLIIGTAGDTCTFGASYSCPTNITSINNGTANPVLVSTHGTTDNLTYQIYGLGIKNCGSATVGCIEYETAQGSTSYASAGTIDIQGSMFDTTGTIQAPVGLSNVTSINLVNNRFLNDLVGVFHLEPTASYLIDGKTCNFQGNVYSAAVGGGAQVEQWKGCTFVGNIWAHGNNFSTVPSRPMSSWSWNLMLLDLAGPPSDFQLSAPLLLNSYWIGNTTGSWHMLAPLPMTQTVDGNIFENINPANAEGHIVFSNADTGAGSYQTILRNSISLMGLSGTTAGTGPMLATNGVPWTVAVIEHNSWFGAAHVGWGAWLDHGINTSDGAFPSNQAYLYYRSNNHWATSGTMNFVLGDAGGNPSEAPNNNFNVTGITNNNIFGGSTAATYHAGINTNCNPSTSLGTHYDICTASGTPGLHDKAVDPKSLDITRNAFQWASRMKGQAATAAGLVAAMMQCQDALYCYQQLWSWVRQGAQPTNMALKGAAHDGTDIGAVQMTAFGRVE